MSVYELLGIASASAFALAFLCAAEAVRYASSRHVVEVWRDVSGRKRRSDLAAWDQRYGHGPGQGRPHDMAAHDVSAQMQALTEIASTPSQDEIVTRVAGKEKGDERAWQG